MVDQEQLNHGIVGHDVWVYAMDSAFLHARALFEFFLIRTTDNHYGCNEFLGGAVVLKSDLYTSEWGDALHRFLMHAQDRSTPAPLKTSAGGEKTLNRMVVEFAREVLRLWEEFEEKLSASNDPENQKLGKLAREKREEAIRKAECVVNSPVAQLLARERNQSLAPIFKM